MILDIKCTMKRLFLLSAPALLFLLRNTAEKISIIPIISTGLSAKTQTGLTHPFSVGPRRIIMSQSNYTCSATAFCTLLASNTGVPVSKESVWLAAWSCRKLFRSQGHEPHGSAKTAALLRFCEHAQWNVQRLLLKAIFYRNTRRLKIPTKGLPSTGVGDESLTRFSTKTQL